MTGKRALSQRTVFDLVTMAFGATFASAILLSDQVTPGKALAAFVLLGGLRYVAARLPVRSGRFRGPLKAQPQLLFHRGEFLERAMRRERVTREEIVAAMRGAGAADPANVDAVVLDTSGSFSVVSGANGGRVGTMRHVQGFEERAGGPL